MWFVIQVDLTGGYYDAGDNVKFGFPMAFTTTLLSWSVIDFGRNMGSELGHAVRAVKWGTDYLLKATAYDGVVYVQVGGPFFFFFLFFLSVLTLMPDLLIGEEAF